MEVQGLWEWFKVRINKNSVVFSGMQRSFCTQWYCTGLAAYLYKV